MTMLLRPLPPDQLRWLHETELQEAFPPEELKPLAAMETLVRRGVCLLYTSPSPRDA